MTENSKLTHCGDDGAPTANTKTITEPDDLLSLSLRPYVSVPESLNTLRVTSHSGVYIAFFLEG